MGRNASLLVAVLLTGGLLFTQGGCAAGGSAGKGAGAVQSSEAPAPLSSVIAGVPFLPQEDDTCGPSSLAMVLGFLGQDVDTAEIVRETRTEGLKGTLITDLAGAARRRGFAAEVADLDLPRLRERISAGVPVILLVDLGIWNWSRPHYLVAYGWTPEGVVAHSGREQGKVIPFSTLDSQWAKMGRLAILVHRPGSAVMAEEARLRSWRRVLPFLLVLLLAGGCSRIPRIIVLEDPLTAAEHVELGVAYERKGELDLALREYERALRKDGKFYRARVNLGNIFLAKKEYGKAREEYLLALELRPGDAEATNNLSWAAIFSGEGIDEALARMEAVVSGTPCGGTPAARSSMGRRRSFWTRWAFSGCAQTAPGRRRRPSPWPSRFAGRPAPPRGRA